VARLYSTAVVELTAEQKADFAGNCMALSDDTVWMSARASAALTDAQRKQLAEAGFTLRAVALDEIEKAGGSLRCCVAEIF